MLTGLVASAVYAAVFLLAVFMLYWFRPVRWYWHVAAVAAAFAIGFMPPMAQWSGPVFDLLIGAAFTLLFVWGVGELFFRLLHLQHHEPHHQP